MSKRTLLKAISCVLSFIMLLSSLPLMSAFSASAKDVAKADIASDVNEENEINPYDIPIDPDSGEYPLVEGYKTIVFDAPEDWSEPHIYCWKNETPEFLEGWPGSKMKLVTNDNGYVAYIPQYYDMIIFSDNGTQTIDVEADKSMGVYADALNSNGKYTVGFWQPEFYDYQSSASTAPTTPDETAPTDIIADTITIYYENTDDWSQVYCYAWNKDDDFPVRPGFLMEHIGNDVYKAVLSASFTHVIFHDNIDNEKSESVILGDNMLYSNGFWTEYFEPTTGTTENIDPSELTVNVNSRVVTWNDGSYNYHYFEADVTGGVAPYTYEFILDGFHFTEDTYSNASSVCIGENGEYSLVVVVTDALGDVGIAEMIIDVDVHEEETIPDDDTYTLYFRNHDNWHSVYAYSWCDNEEGTQPLGLWPGTKCKYVNDDIWAIEVTDNFDYIIFNDARNQTNILSNPGGFNIARWISTDGNECEYEWEFPIITDPTETTEATEPQKEDIKLYFDNSESYDQVFAYVWGGESDEYGYISQWPGVLCEDENNGTWSVMVPADCEYVLFHNGYSVQTNDLKNPGETKIAKVVEVANGMDIYDWFDVEEITTTVTEPTEQITTEADTLPSATDPTEEITTEAYTEPTEENDYLRGDANLDGKVNIFDVTVIDKYSVNDAILSDNPIALKAADFNENTVVNFKDAIALQEYLASEREIKPEFSGADADGVNIDGKNYPVVRGGIYTYNLFIDTPKSIENIQAYVAYDAEKLRFINNSKDYPLLVYCTEGIKEGLIAFNFSTAFDEYNFEDGKILVKLQFKVLDSSASEIVAVIENMAEYGGSIYYEDGEKKNDDVKVYHTFEPDNVPSESEYALGDVDRDGKISVFDATRIMKYLAKLAGMIDEEYRYLADVNMDEIINIRDASVIQKYLALLIAIEDNREIVPEFAGATEDGVNIDGENYKVEVGDTLTYELCIKAPKYIENIQAYVAFDSSKLRLLDDEYEVRFPNMTGVVSNVVDGLVVFNASEISTGFDYLDGEVAVYLEFEVLDSSATEIVAVIENMAEFFGDVYFEDGEQKNDDVELYHTVDIAPKPTEPDYEGETGDVNLDSKINIFDVTLIQKFLAKSADFSDEVLYKADYNNDGKINIKDATAIQKYLALVIGDRVIVPEFSGATEDGVNIDGENYKVEAGDTFTYEFCIETPEKIENIQAYVAFDSAKLRLIDAEYRTRFPNMTGVVSNVVDGLVVFNASEISTGFDYLDGEVAVYLEFEVLDSSATEIAAVIENMAEFYGDVYFEDGEQKNDEVKLYHTVDIDSKPTEPTTAEPTTTEPATSEATEESTATVATEPVTTATVTTAPATIAPSEPEFEIGDVNGDSKINIKDVTSIQKYLAKMLDFSQEILLLADFNGDSVINIKDATTIQKKLANLI